MWPSDEEVVPQRAWSELIALSTQRGEALRRRRQVTAVAPVLAAAVFVGAGSAASLRQPPSEVVTMPPSLAQEPRPQEPRQQEPRPQAARSSEAAAPPATPPPAAPRADGTRAPGVTATSAPTVLRPVPPARPSPTSAAPRAPRRTPTPRPAPPASREVVVPDDQGDARASDGQVQTSSRPALDIVEMRFLAGRDGVLVEMTLLDDAQENALFTAELTDRQTGCTVEVRLRALGSDGALLRCPTQRRQLRLTRDEADPRAFRLRAFVAYSVFPREVRPERPLRLSGASYDDPPPPPPPPGVSQSEQPSAPGVTRYDSASTAQTLRRP